MQVQPNIGQNLLALGGVNLNPPSLIIPEGNSQGYFALHAMGTPSANGCVPFVKDGVIYQVTAGKTCKVVAAVWVGSAAGDGYQLLSATAAFAFDAGSGSLTGAVWQGGAAAKYGYRVKTASEFQQASIPYSFGASTYPGVQSQVADIFHFILICKEV